MMKVLRSVSYYVTPLNLLLCAAVALVCAGTVLPLTRAGYRFVLPRIAAVQPLPEEKLEESAAPATNDYAVIGDLNLFHPQRITPAGRDAELPKPELILYGTIIEGNERLAFIRNKKGPVTTPGRGDRQTVVKKGSVISGFTVTEISQDRIVLVRGEERITVGLTEGEKRSSGKGAPSHSPVPSAKPPVHSSPLPPGMTPSKP